MAQAPMRLFVAIYPPPGAAGALLEAAGKLYGSGHRFTPAGQVHLTALFIGDTDPRQLKDVSESVERAAARIGAFELQALDLVTLPEGPGPRLLAARTDCPSGLLELHKRLVLRLARAKGKRERFVPHVTLVRFGAGKIAPLKAGEVPLTGLSMRVESVSLMQSRLHASGAEHVEVRRVGLS